MQPKLIPIWFISFQILSLVNPFVSMSAMLASDGTCFVAEHAVATVTFLCVAVLPTSQFLSKATTGNRVTVKQEWFLRRSCVSPTDLALLQSFATGILTESVDDKAPIFCVIDNPSCQ